MVPIVQGSANLVDKAYQPNPINIKVGSTITCINHDTAIHTVTEGNPANNVPQNGFDSGVLGVGQQYQHSFTKAGNVGCHCTLHPTMIGSIIVS
jgi:plastocyanin